MKKYQLLFWGFTICTVQTMQQRGVFSRGNSPVSQARSSSSNSAALTESSHNRFSHSAWAFSDDNELIRAKCSKSRQYPVIDVKATWCLGLFLRKHYWIDWRVKGDFCVVFGSVAQWDETTWRIFSQLVERGVSCKGALNMFCKDFPISQQSVHDFFEWVTRYYTNAHYTDWPAIKTALASQCSRYSYLAKTDTQE